MDSRVFLEEVIKNIYTIVINQEYSFGWSRIIIKDILGTCGPEWQRQVAIFSPLHSIEAPSWSAGKPRNCRAGKKCDLNIHFLTFLWESCN